MSLFDLSCVVWCCVQNGQKCSKRSASREEFKTQTQWQRQAKRQKDRKTLCCVHDGQYCSKNLEAGWSLSLYPLSLCPIAHVSFLCLFVCLCSQKSANVDFKLLPNSTSYYACLPMCLQTFHMCTELLAWCRMKIVLVPRMTQFIVRKSSLIQGGDKILSTSWAPPMPSNYHLLAIYA